MVFQIKNVSSAIIFGACGGIGRSLTEKLKELNPNLELFLTSRRKDKLVSTFPHASEERRINLVALDPTDEEQLQSFAERVSKKTSSIDLIINAVGLLHNEQLTPEKKIQQVLPANLLKLFEVNSIVTPLIGKYFFQLLKDSEQACFAAISAKVGSIGDNQLGGWYGYRASKAALNMFLKNMAIEFGNRGSRCIVIALHPGTTETSLSKSFLAKTKLKVHSPLETATNLLKVIEGLTLSDSGSFLSWDGSELPW